jgi:predicted transcriptional regulator
VINTKLLEKKISDSGMTMVSLAEKTGILRESLYNKLKGNTEFKASEISSLSKVLRLSTRERDAIFFDSEVN